MGRAELQSLCKYLGVRAVGKSSELQERARGALLLKDPSCGYVEDDRSGQVFASEVSLSVKEGEASEKETGGEFSVLFDDMEESGDSSMGVAEVLPPLTVNDLRPLFPTLSNVQWTQVEDFKELLIEWNQKVNLISRKDIGNLMGRHMVPCLALAKAFDFADGTEVLDVGTGGGLPGLPLAICFPRVSFVLIDGRGKKIRAVQDMASRLGLLNVRAVHIRAEEVHDQYDYVLGRAVSSLPKFMALVEKNLKRNYEKGSSDHMVTVNEVSWEDSSKSGNSSESPLRPRLKHGVLYMRGEATDAELAELGAKPSKIFSISDILGDGGLVGAHMRDRGYSSVFHFASEDIYNRIPAPETEE
ncbi:unnamed protein product [Choristocarpus tenellus]